MKLVVRRKPKINLENLTKERIIEDIKGFLGETEWWSEPRQYKTDTRAIKINLGYAKGASKMRHVKKGAPFTKSVPKRRPKGKGSAPPLVENKNGQQKLISFFLNLKAKPGSKATLTAVKNIPNADIKKGDAHEVQHNPEKNIWTFKPAIQGQSELGEVDLRTAIYFAKLSISDFKISQKTQKDVEVSKKQAEKIIGNLVKTYAPEIAKTEGYFEQLKDSFMNSPFVKTVKEIAMWFYNFIMYFVKGMGLDYLFGMGKGITTDQQADMGLGYKELRKKFIGYKGQETGWRGYVYFLWDEYDKNRDNPLIQGWTKEKTLMLVREIAPKYNLPVHVAMGVMAGESGHAPTGVFGQTRGRKGSPEEALNANSSAYGMGAVTQTTYEAIKDKVGVPHYMLWNPRYGIEASIATIANNIKLRGSLAGAVRLYAGTPGGGVRKMRAIKRAKKLYP